MASQDPVRPSAGCRSVARLAAAVFGFIATSILPAIHAEDVSVPRERLAALEARSRRVESLEAEVRRLEAEVRRLQTGSAAIAADAAGAAPAGVARLPSAQPPASWLTPAAAQAAAQAGPAPALEGRLTKGSTVDLAHVLSHFGSEPATALTRYKGVRVRFHGVVAEVDKPLFMAPYDVVFRRSDTPVRVRARVTPPGYASRVFVAADRSTVVAEGGGRREVLARVGDAVGFDGVIKGFASGMVELVVLGTPGPWTGP